MYKPFVITKLRLSLNSYIAIAKKECAKSKYSKSCKVSYDNVEEISSTLAKQKRKYKEIFIDI